MEGCCGSGKRKNSLALIMARLTKGGETTISMAFLVMCAEKRRRLPRLFFVTILFCFNTGQGRASLWTSFRENRWLETADLLLGG